ncbi:hypothetical protein [Rhodobacter lacus]|uniref:Uncharacterized protein n=1 Tax=Rhodobacter lacus TaxID=1641972 RepID=A0ABW5A9U9_9RHOB
MMDLPQLSGLGAQNAAPLVPNAPANAVPSARAESFEKMLAPSGGAEMQALVLAIATVEPGSGVEPAEAPRPGEETATAIAPAEAQISLTESLFSALHGPGGSARDTMSGGALAQQYKALLNGIR